MKCDNLRIGKLFKGQFWVELHGIFKPDELRMLADQIEDKTKKEIIKNDNTKRS